MKRLMLLFMTIYALTIALALALAWRDGKFAPAWLPASNKATVDKIRPAAR